MTVCAYCGGSGFEVVGVGAVYRCQAGCGRPAPHPVDCRCSECLHQDNVEADAHEAWANGRGVG